MAGVEGRADGLPGADEFAAVVGLDRDIVESNLVDLEVLGDALGEQLRVGQREFTGVGQEEDPGGDVAGGILITGKIKRLRLQPVFG